MSSHIVINISGIQVGAENLTEALYKRLLEAERKKVSILKAALNHEFPIEELVSDYLLTELGGDFLPVSATTGHVLFVNYGLNNGFGHPSKGINEWIWNFLIPVHERQGIQFRIGR